MKIQKITVPHSLVSESDIVFTLDFLAENELQTAKQCHEDIQDILQTSNRIKRFTCCSIEDFNQATKEIQKYSKQGFSPLVHVHGHGDQNKGVKLSKSNDYLSWEKFIAFFDEIKSSAGNLTVIMSCCYSYTIINLIYNSGQLNLPFAFFYGYEYEITSGIVQDEIKLINNSFFQDGGKSLNEHIKKMRIKPFSEFDYMNKFLSIILTEYEIGKTRNNIVLAMPKEATLFARHYFNDYFRDNPIKLIKELANQIIENPERRKNYLDSIEKQIAH